MDGDQATANALSAKLFKILNPEDGGEGSYFSMIKGGYPIAPNSMQWTTKGIFAENEKYKEDARRFSTLANTITTTTGVWSSAGYTMDSAYQNWMNNAVFPLTKLSQDEKLLIEQADDTLQRGYKKYKAAKAEYDRIALQLHVADQIETPRSPEKVATLKNQLKDAEDEWGAFGYKKEVPAAIAAKNQLASRGFATAIDSLNSKFGKTKDECGFLPVEIVPVDFHANNDSWTKVTFSSSETSSMSSAKSSSWGGGAEFSYGLWSAGGEGGQSSSEKNMKSQGTDLSVEFEMCRTALIRSWFDAYLLFGRDWRWQAATAANPTAGETFSDGAGKGSWPTLTTDAIWIRNLKIKFGSTTTSSQEITKTVEASASAGFWIFKVKGNYSSSSSESKFETKITGNSIECPGMQLVGFMARYLPKLPNPRPDVFPVPSLALAAPAIAVTAPANQQLAMSFASSVDGILSKGKDAWDKGKGIIAAGKDTYNSVKNSWETVKGLWKDMQNDQLDNCSEHYLTSAQQMDLIRDLSKKQTPVVSSVSPDGTSAIFYQVDTKWEKGTTIKCCFAGTNRNADLEKVVIGLAKGWEKYATKIKFDFQTAYETVAEIPVRITFEGNGAATMGAGLQLLKYIQDHPHEPSMVLGTVWNLWNNKSMDKTEVAKQIQRKVLHEFGHVLGLLHEHQSPNSDKDLASLINIPVYATAQGISQENAVFNLQRMAKDIKLKATTFDPKSIMLYALPKPYWKKESDYPAWSFNWELSEVDKTAIGKMYGEGSDDGGLGIAQDDVLAAQLVTIVQNDVSSPLGVTNDSGSSSSSSSNPRSMDRTASQFWKDLIL